jgi:type III secretion protein U
VSGARTEAPTPRRLREARRRGQVAASSELTAAAALAGALVALWLGGAGLVRDLAAGLRAALLSAAAEAPAPAEALAAAAAATLRAALLPAAGALAGALAGGLLQTGFLFAPAALRPRLERLDPIRGARRLVSPVQLVAVALGLLKGGALLLLGAAWLKAAVRSLSSLARAGPAVPWRALPLVGGLLLQLALALLALGFLDHLRVRWLHLRVLRLTREEVRREHREDEGDPSLRGERRRLHRGLLSAGPVARATVVVVNPEHVAVALRHDRGGPDAPRVVAKGADRAAARIRSLARRAGVPVVRDVPLARALHRLVDVGDEIPEELYQAAAVVLAHLYGRGEPA